MSNLILLVILGEVMLLMPLMSAGWHRWRSRT